MKTSLEKALTKIYRENKFWNFNNFICKEMGFPNNPKKAFEVFEERTNKAQIASRPTMRKWFDLGGHARPSRLQIYEMAFYMGLDEDQVQRYLTEGIGEPGIQINDYQEAILIYGLSHDLSYDECTDMIREFEWKMDEDMEIDHDSATIDLWQKFRVEQEVTREEFLNWMIMNASAFRGYSLTALNYMIKYKKTVNKLIRRDAKEYLNNLLADTDYKSWLHRRHIQYKMPGETIRRYIYTNKNLEESIRREILVLTEIVYYEDSSNVRLISEIYATSKDQKHSQQSRWQRIRRMTEKYLSDLLNVAIQKERDIRTAHLESYLNKQKDLTDKEICPDWANDLINEYTVRAKKKSKDKKYTVKEAKEWVSKYRREHKRRCIQVGREDLLPFVLYITQNRYLTDIDFMMEEYDAEEAKRQFLELADQTMTACNMMKISGKYELDAALLASFQEDDMYSFAEILEFIEGMD